MKLVLSLTIFLSAYAEQRPLRPHTLGEIRVGDMVVFPHNFELRIVKMGPSLFGLLGAQKRVATVNLPSHSGGPVCEVHMRHDKLGEGDSVVMGDLNRWTVAKNTVIVDSGYGRPVSLRGYLLELVHPSSPAKMTIFCPMLRGPSALPLLQAGIRFYAGADMSNNR